MPKINLADVSLSKLRAYRDFAFQHPLTDQFHRPFFSLDCPEEWTTISGYELFETWLKNSKDLSQDIGHAQALIDSATASDIKKFREIITTPEYAKIDYFSTDNFHNWIRPVAFEAWMVWFREAVREEGLRTSSRMSSYTASSISRPPSRMSETADLSSDWNLPRSSRATSSVSQYSISSSSPDVIVISDDDEDEDGMPQKSAVNCVVKEEPDISHIPRAINLKRSRSISPEIKFMSGSSAGITKGNRKNSKGKSSIPTDTSPKSCGPIKLTSKLIVDSLSTITSLPSTWTVPRDNSATLLDLSAMDNLPDKPNGGRYTIDALIRAEDQDSWGGSAGRSVGEVYVFGFNEDDPEESVRCRRAYLHCNGVDICEHFDQDILDNCERYDPDPDQMRDLWYRELDANSREANDGMNIVSRFYTEAQRLKCKVPCDGKPMMRKLVSGRSKYGKEYFIGCSAWRYTERDKHRYLPIPSNVDEDILKTVMAQDGVLPLNIASNSNASCVLVVHPRVALKACPYSHIIDGKISHGSIIERKCPTRMAIYIPVDTSIRKAIVYLRNPHNHPMYPKTKPSTEEKDKVRKAINAAGKRGLTVRKLINAPSTSAIYNSTPLPIASPAFMDRRKLRDEIRKEKLKDYPKGLGWEGLLHEHMQRESKLPADKRYIQAVMVTPEAKWVITMHPRLAKHFHSVLYLCIDYTFKRVKGDIDEWEVVGFLDRFKRRVTLARFYCDRNTRNAFARLFSELFRIIPELTGSILKFFAFFPGDPKALLRAIILDAEAPQAQGLGDELLVYVAKYVPETTLTVPRNALELLMTVLKTCCIHFERNIEKLPTTVPRETIARLKGFMGLRTHEEIQDWHDFCRNSPDKSVRDWHQQKLNHQWLLPSLNAFLSKMDGTSWNLTPNHSNLVESGHSGTNDITSIGKDIGEAVTSTRELDNKVADELEAMEWNAVLPKRWNGPSEREHLNTQRRAWSHAKQKDRDDKLAHHDEFSAELQRLSSQQADSLKLDKSLQAQIQILRDNKNANWKDEIKAIQQQIEAEKEKRRGYKTQRQIINKSIQGLKDDGLSGARIHGRRPALSAENTTAEKELFDSYGPANNVPVGLVLEESVSTFPPTNVQVHESHTNMQGSTSEPQFESFTAMLNSQEDDWGNDALFLVPVEHDHHPCSIDSTVTNTTSGFSSPSTGNSMNFGFDYDGGFDFGNMDIYAGGVNPSPDVSATFDYEQAFTEAALSIGHGVQVLQENRSETLQLDGEGSQPELPPDPSHPNVDAIQVATVTSAGPSIPVLSSTSGGLGALALPEPDGIHAHCRPIKRKKVDEVNAAHILPEGLQRSRKKSAKASAARESDTY